MINGKKAIAICGVESTGKSTLAMMVAGRLRTRGFLAQVSQVPGYTLPFHPSFYDEGTFGWMYAVTNKIQQEAALATRPGVDFIVCDRSPLDFVAYCYVRFGPDAPFVKEMHDIALAWTAQYDEIYFLPIEGSVYREDGFRAPAGQNNWREATSEWLGSNLSQLGAINVEGNYRKRAEFVYHHTLAAFTGETRPLRAYEQIRSWFTDRGFRILEVKPQGSNSITRFHPPSDRDDIDAMIVVDGGVDYAKEVRAAFWEDKEHMENVVQANLDILVTPKGMEAHEV